MKKLLLIISILPLSLSVFAHGPDEPIKVDCFFSEAQFAGGMMGNKKCTDELVKKGDCFTTLVFSFSMGPHKFIKRKETSGNAVGGLDVKVIGKFKDGKKYKKILLALMGVKSLHDQLGSNHKDLSRFYHGEEFESLECLVL